MTKFRGEKYLRRRAGKREPKPVILIVCEGQTEQLYFEALRLR